MRHTQTEMEWMALSQTWKKLTWDQIVCCTPSTQALHRFSSTPTRFTSRTSILWRGQSPGIRSLISNWCSSTRYAATTSLMAAATFIDMLSSARPSDTACDRTCSSSVLIRTGEKWVEVYAVTVFVSCRSLQSSIHEWIRPGTLRRAR